jgi:peptidoglycan/xylan/chitin deacetylase (PgdA/CDA1 family)
MSFVVYVIFLLAAVIFFSPSISSSETACKCVVFTLDGVQDYFLTNVQMDIIRMFDQKDANLTIGIIGNQFGVDNNMTSFIKNEVDVGHKKSIIEVANNGWKDEDFGSLSQEQQSDRINKTQARLNYLLKIQPLAFIAPYGNINNDTIEALDKANLRYTSAYWESSNVPIYLNTSRIYIIPPTLNTGILNSQSGMFEMIPYDQLVQAIRESITENGVAVVSMQPMEFAQRNQTDYVNESNGDEIEKLGLLLDNLRKINVPILTFKQFSEYIE